MAIGLETGDVDMLLQKAVRDMQRNMSTTASTSSALSTIAQDVMANLSSSNGTGLSGDACPRGPPGGEPSEIDIILVSLLFSAITLVGLTGNLLVMYIILSDPKMRRSVTNLFIFNLAVSDFLILAFGVPEIVQFMMGGSWLLGLVACKLHRYILVAALYASIMTLTAVCVERYIAIVHPIKAHIFCSRRRILVAITIIWPVSMFLALPTPLFNDVRPPAPCVPIELCMVIFPGNAKLMGMVYNTAEFFVFFLVPIVSQVVLYSIVSCRLFSGTKNLHRKQTIRQDGIEKERESDAIRARKGVVKMLIATVIVYFVSYAPVQFRLLYNLISATKLKQNWSILALFMTLCAINSAANPILYSIFSQNFRRKFSRVLCLCKTRDPRYQYRRSVSQTMESYSSKGNTRFTSMKLNTAFSEM